MVLFASTVATLSLETRHQNFEFFFVVVLERGRTVTFEEKRNAICVASTSRHSIKRLHRLQKLECGNLPVVAHGLERVIHAEAKLGFGTPLCDLIARYGAEGTKTGLKVRNVGSCYVACVLCIGPGRQHR